MDDEYEYVPVYDINMGIGVVRKLKEKKAEVKEKVIKREHPDCYCGDPWCSEC